MPPRLLTLAALSLLALAACDEAAPRAAVAPAAQPACIADVQRADGVTSLTVATPDPAAPPPRVSLTLDGGPLPGACLNVPQGPTTQIVVGGS